ncbi:MAG: hypothetical protein H6713_37700 [Myxococcales bacterium]|nr:hypothetical protein [Myxococcales bacterium]MCB9755701.1 hypothetical protein [Myxococcales bacterium]
MRKIHLMNDARRDATLAMDSVKAAPTPSMGLPDTKLQFRRYLAATEDGLPARLTKKHGKKLAQALVDGDPEIDVEQVGRVIGDTHTVFLSSAGTVLHASPRVVDVLFNPDGSERERADPKLIPANTNEEDPIKWTGRKVAKKDAVTSFAFRRTVQIKHVDGLTYDFLYGMAKELAEEGKVVMMGGGKKGKGPLIFQDNGKPYRGFLEGRVDGAKYKLLLHLSDMELKVPTV